MLSLRGGDDGRLTGIEAVDHVIQTVEAGNTEALTALISLQAVDCIEGTGSRSAPSCVSPETPDTPVEALEVLRCEPSWERDETLTATLQEIAATEASLYSAFEGTPEHFMRGEQVLIFVGRDTRTVEAPPRGIVLGLEDGRIIGMALGCGIGEPVHFLLPHTPVRYLVQPAD